MDRIMNTHLYPLDLIEEKFNMCAYNAYKKECIGKRNHYGYTYTIPSNLSVEHERKKFLVNYHPTGPTAPILKFTTPFLDEDGQMKRLPHYVVEQITEAVGSINVYPDPLSMNVAGDNYVLSVTYIDDRDYNTRTDIKLEYTFNKNVRQFEGYFAKSIENEHRLPDYQDLIRGADHEKEMSILVDYSNGSSLKVDIKCRHSFTLLLKHLPDQLQNYLTNDSLCNAVLCRIFPTKAHYCKYLINEIVVKGESDFLKDMALTPLNWVKLSTSDDTYNLYAKYTLTCYGINYSQPIVDKQLFVVDKIKAMKILIEKYPFFTIDDQPRTDICLVDLWIDYFKENLTKEHALKMKLSDSALKNLTTYCSLDPVKYDMIFELFPSVSVPIMLKEFQGRYNILKNKNHEGNAVITSEDVIYFNRLKSTLPTKWRFYLCRGTFDEPVYESGQDIIKKMRDDIPPANAIEKINYLDIENEKHLLPVFQMMTIITPLANDLEILQPEYLEQIFQSYRFSKTYKTAPTEMDSLAVRFANVYKETGYNVPKIPDDFLDRLINLEEPEKRNESELNCIICMKWTKSHMFPTCKHVCVCELCSYTILKCPLCCQVGNPQKVFL